MVSKFSFGVFIIIFFLSGCTDSNSKKRSALSIKKQTLVTSGPIQIELLPHKGVLAVGGATIPIQVRYTTSFSSRRLMIRSISVCPKGSQKAVKVFSSNFLRKNNGSLLLQPNTVKRIRLSVPLIAGTITELAVKTVEFVPSTSLSSQSTPVQAQTRSIYTQIVSKHRIQLDAQTLRSYPKATPIVRHRTLTTKELKLKQEFQEQRLLFTKTIAQKLEGEWKSLSKSERRRRIIQLKSQMFKKLMKSP